MPDPIPKPKAQRRRRNKDAVSGVKLNSAARASVPPLPGAESLHERTLAWWETVWTSPMAKVWLEADVPALVRLAELIDLANRGHAKVTHFGEIRQLEDRFGLSPLARRRLQWELEQAGGEKPASEPSGGDEARWLRAVSD